MKSYRNTTAKYLIFKSVRGIARPWLVFSPSDRLKPMEYMWDDGFATWQEAFDAVADSLKPNDTAEYDVLDLSNGGQF